MDAYDFWVYRKLGVELEHWDDLGPRDDILFGRFDVVVEEGALLEKECSPTRSTGAVRTWYCSRLFRRHRRRRRSRPRQNEVELVEGNLGFGQDILLVEERLEKFC